MLGLKWNKTHSLAVVSTHNRIFPLPLTFFFQNPFIFLTSFGQDKHLSSSSDSSAPVSHPCQTSKPSSSSPCAYSSSSLCHPMTYTRIMSGIASLSTPTRLAPSTIPGAILSLPCLRGGFLLWVGWFGHQFVLRRVKFGFFSSEGWIWHCLMNKTVCFLLVAARPTSSMICPSVIQVRFRVILGFWN